MKKSKSVMKRVGSALLAASMVLTLTPQLAGAAALGKSTRSYGMVGSNKLVSDIVADATGGVFIITQKVERGHVTSFTVEDKNGIPFREGTVKWTIGDENGAPIPGVSIDSVKGQVTVADNVPVGTPYYVYATIGDLSGMATGTVRPNDDETTVKANSFTYYARDGWVTTTQVKKLAEVTAIDAVDENGQLRDALDDAYVSVDERELNALNNAIGTHKGGQYALTFTNTETMQTATITVTVMVERMSIWGASKDILAGSSMQYTVEDANENAADDIVWAVTDESGAEIPGLTVDENGMVSASSDMETPVIFVLTATQGVNYALIEGCVYGVTGQAAVWGNDLIAGKTAQFTAMDESGTVLKDGVWTLEKAKDAADEPADKWIGDTAGDDVMTIDQNGVVAVGKYVPEGISVEVVYTPSATTGLMPGLEECVVQPGEADSVTLVADNIIYPIENGILTTARLKALANLQLIEDGVVVNSDRVGVLHSDLECLNMLIGFGLFGETYSATFVDTKTQEELQITVKLVSNALTISGENVVYNNGDTTQYTASIGDEGVDAYWSVTDSDGNEVAGLTIDDDGVLKTDSSVPDSTKFVVTAWTEDGYTNTYEGIVRTKVTVYFSCPGDLPEEKTAVVGDAYGPLPTISVSGYTFLGWFTEEDGGTQVTEDTPITITTDHKLYAHMEKQASGEGSGSGGNSGNSNRPGTVRPGNSHHNICSSAMLSAYSLLMNLIRFALSHR